MGKRRSTGHFSTGEMAAYFESNWWGRELGPQVSGALFAKALPIFLTGKMAAYFEGNFRELGSQVSGALFANYHGKWASVEALPIFLTRKMAAYFEANRQGGELGP